MPVLFGRNGQRVLGARRGRRGHGQRGGGPEASTDRNLRSDGDRQAIVSHHVHRHPCRQVAGVVGHARPLTLAGDDQA
jgi:hypothetical protein